MSRRKLEAREVWSNSAIAPPTSSDERDDVDRAAFLRTRVIPSFNGLLASPVELRTCAAGRPVGGRAAEHGGAQERTPPERGEKRWNKPPSRCAPTSRGGLTRSGEKELGDTGCAGLWRRLGRPGLSLRALREANRLTRFVRVLGVGDTHGSPSRKRRTCGCGGRRSGREAPPCTGPLRAPQHDKAPRAQACSMTPACAPGGAARQRTRAQACSMTQGRAPW